MHMTSPWPSPSISSTSTDSGASATVSVAPNAAAAGAMSAGVAAVSKRVRNASTPTTFEGFRSIRSRGSAAIADGIAAIASASRVRTATAIGSSPATSGSTPLITT